MAVTILSSPPDIGLSGNDMWFELQTDKYITANGSFAINHLSFATPGALEETLIFQFKDNEIGLQFVFKASPNPDEPLELPAYVSGTTAAWMESIVPYFKAHYLMNLYYNISFQTVVGQPRIVFASKAKGDEWNIAESGTADATVTQFLAGFDVEFNENYFIAADIYVEEDYLSDTYTKLPTQFLKPDLSQKAQINVASFLWPFVSGRNNYNLPDYDELIPVLSTQTNKRYFVSFTDYYGNPAEYKKITNSDTDFVSGMGIRKEEFAIYPDFVDTYLFQTKGLLTWRKKRWVTDTQQDYFTYLHWHDNTVLINRFSRIYYTDGSNTFFNLGFYEDINYGEMIRIPAGYTNSGLAALANPLKKPYKYELWIQFDPDGDPETGDTQTEKITFYLEDSEYQEKIFLFENSLTAMETVRAFGEWQRIVSLNKTELEYILGKDYDLTTPETEFDNNITQTATTASILCNSLEELRALIDFVRSRHIFIANQNPTAELRSFIPVKIKPDKFEMGKKDNFHYILNFEYEIAYNNNFYSKLLTDEL
jgi:hypothetical protein